MFLVYIKLGKFRVEVIYMYFEWRLGGIGEVSGCNYFKDFCKVILEFK